MTKQQVIDILESYKPSGNIYNGYNSIEEKIDERICYLIDEIIESVKREPDNEGAVNMENKYYIIRAEKAGVFAGNIKERNGGEVTLINARRLWYWDGAASLSQLAVDGVKRPDNCKFTVTVPEITILGVIEIIPCSDIAEKCIKGVKEWKI